VLQQCKEKFQNDFKKVFNCPTGPVHPVMVTTHKEKMSTKDKEEVRGEEETKQGEAPKDFNQRLFDLRLKINQSRKANHTEVEEEYNRFYVKPSRKNKKSKGKLADDEENSDEDNPRKGKSATTKSGKIEEEKNQIQQLLDQTAEEAEWLAEKNRRKKETAETYGLNAFTTDAYYRAYENRAEKLKKNNFGKKASDETPLTSAVASSSSSSSLEANPFDYGRTNSETSPEALEYLRNDIINREKQRQKFSKRRLQTDAADVDYINDKNAQFNKKLKRAFDKYTLEIRQNLERGTAI
jgi:pre-mRNA-splicing factor SYF2